MGSWSLRPGGTAAAAILIAIAILAAYSNSFHVPFVFDDIGSIEDNETIRSLWPIWKPLSPPPATTVTGRPVANLTLAINYGLGGLEPSGYHAFNLAVHALAALTLFGVVRRTLLLPSLRPRFGQRATALALAVALVWAVHPLQTESVTYIVQRVESLMGFFYLFTLYCLIRGAHSGPARWWRTTAVCACALGMGTKEAMVSAPVVVLLYDRVFLGGSLRETLRRRGGVHAALWMTWSILAVEIVRGAGRTGTVSLRTVELTPLHYAMTQCEYLVRYIQLAFWPSPLIIDYGGPDAGVPIVRSLSGCWPWALIILFLLAATGVALRSVPRAGFLGAAFFAILAPSSSIVPIITEVAAEHRMYLPLACLVVLVALGGFTLATSLPAGGRSLPGRGPGLAILGGLVLAAITASFGWLTFTRNSDYGSALSLWDDTIRKRGSNQRAYINRGTAYETSGRLDLAIADYTRAIDLEPIHPIPRNNRGLVYVHRGMAYEASGQLDLAIADCTRAIDLNPIHPIPRYNRGLLHVHRGQYREAIADFDTAIKLDPKSVEGYNNRGYALQKLGRHDDAIRDFDRAIALKQDHVNAYNNRGIALSGKGLYRKAIDDFTRAIELEPEAPVAYGNRAAAYYYLGDTGRSWKDVRMFRTLGGAPDPPFVRSLPQVSDQAP